MNYIDLGYFNGHLLHLIGCTYVNNSTALILLNKNIEYTEVTKYDESIKLSSQGYLILNPNMSMELKKFLMKKNIFRVVKIISNMQIAMINRNVYDKLFMLNGEC